MSPDTARLVEGYFTSFSLGEYFIEDIRSTFQGTDDAHLVQASAPRAVSEMSSFQPASLETVRDIIKGTPNKSCILDPLPTALVKENLDLFLPHFVNIINKSLAMCHVPPQLKSAVVIPVLKKDSLPLC